MADENKVHVTWKIPLMTGDAIHRRSFPTRAIAEEHARDVRGFEGATDVEVVDEEELRAAGPIPRLPVLAADDVKRIFKRAGLNPLAIDDLLHDRCSRSALRRIACALLDDSVREDARWSERVKRLELRIDFAVDALRGKGETDASTGG